MANVAAHGHFTDPERLPNQIVKRAGRDGQGAGADCHMRVGDHRDVMAN